MYLSSNHPPPPPHNTPTPPFLHFTRTIYLQSLEANAFAGLNWSIEIMIVNSPNV